MTQSIQLSFNHHPPVLSVYLLGLLTRRTGLKTGELLPKATSQWQHFIINKKHLSRFFAASQQPFSHTMPILYPLSIVFPLHMSILGHKRFPLSPFSMLQIRNHIVQLRPTDIDEKLDIHCTIAKQRNTAKGMELDIRSTLKAGEETVWEGINTYFFRGFFGDEDPLTAQSRRLRELSDTPKENTWTMLSGGGFNFARLSGDYNGIHFSSLYARMLGYESSFAHSQVSLIQCLNRLPKLKTSRPIQLDAAFKGPVYYKTETRIKYDVHKTGFRFDLFSGQNNRPSLCGEIKKVLE